MVASLHGVSVSGYTFFVFSVEGSCSLPELAMQEANRSSRCSCYYVLSRADTWLTSSSSFFAGVVNFFVVESVYKVQAVNFDTDVRIFLFLV